MHYVGWVGAGQASPLQRRRPDDGCRFAWTRGEIVVGILVVLFAIIVVLFLLLLFVP
jgi:hypothetical protein